MDDERNENLPDQQDQQGKKSMKPAKRLSLKAIVLFINEHNMNKLLINI